MTRIQSFENELNSTPTTKNPILQV